MAAAQDRRPRASAKRLGGTALVLGALVAPAVAFDPVTAAPLVGAPLISQTADPCPAAYPVRSIASGQAVNGLTVEKGVVPDPFTGEIVGVIRNGIAPGLDMIIAELDSPAIARAGGIWAGMSGSPVYAADGRLIGAVAYGLSFASSPIAGITPAAAMYRLLDGGSPTTAAATAVDLPAKLERQIVGSGAATGAEAARGMAPLPTPVGVSGLSARRLQRASKRFAEHFENAEFHRAGAASAGAAAIEPEPGGNVAVALAFGDASVGGVGTITAVCDGEALLFGHPMTFLGATTMSAHEATAVYVQPDLIGGPFKVANFGGIVGTVDQDRLAGVRTEVGTTPPSARIRSNLTALDTGASRRGTTRVVLPEFMADGTFVHTLVNLDRVADRIGGGVVEYTWTAKGTREDGSPWRLRRREKFADLFDATFFAAIAPAESMFQIQSNPFEDVTVDSVQLRGTVSSTYRAARIVGMQVRGGRGRWRTIEEGSDLRIVAGARTELRVLLQQHRRRRIIPIELALTAPRRFAGSFGQLFLAGGGQQFFDEPSTPPSFDALLRTLASQPSGDTVLATLALERFRPPGRTQIRARRTAPSFVEGFAEFFVQVVPPPAP